jgi:hypothetical protein
MFEKCRLSVRRSITLVLPAMPGAFLIPESDEMKAPVKVQKIHFPKVCA